MAPTPRARKRAAALAVVALLMAETAPAAPAFAADEAPAPAQEEAAPDRKARLDALFAKLAEAPDEDSAEKIALQIGEVWSDSGSDTINLLMTRGHKAMSGGSMEEAYSHFSRVVAFAPDYPEGWNARATASYLEGDLGGALTDVARALRLEPRHYDALAGLGAIFEKLERPREALEAYRAALKIHPWLPGAKDGARRLAPDVDGRAI